MEPERNKRRIRREDRRNQAELESIIRENPDLFRGGNVNLLGEAEVEGTYGEVNNRRRRRKKEFIEDLPEVGKEISFELARMAPFLGEGIDTAEILNSTQTGEDLYGNEASTAELAGMMAAGLLIPNIIERPAKKLYRGIKRFFRKGGDSGYKPTIKKPAVKGHDLKKTPPNRTGFGVGSRWNNERVNPLPDSEMTPSESVYHEEINTIKDQINSEEGKKRVRKMITDEVKFLEADPNTPQEVRDDIARLLFDEDLMDKKVQEVFHGGSNNKGFMNTKMQQADPSDRAHYTPSRNLINPDSDKMSADHEMAHSIQYNILNSLGLPSNRLFSVGERVDLQKQGFRTHGRRGLRLDRDIIGGVHMTDDPNLLRPRTDDRLLVPKSNKAYAEEGFDIDFLNPDNPSKEINLVNAQRGHRTNEPYPMMAEERRRMMDEGILPSRHSEVTEKMMEMFRGSLSGNKGLTSATDFQSPTMRSFANRRMAELMNRMPALVPTLAGTGYLASQRGQRRESGF